MWVSRRTEASLGAGCRRRGPFGTHSSAGVTLTPAVGAVQQLEEECGSGNLLAWDESRLPCDLQVSYLLYAQSPLLQSRVVTLQDC